MINEHREYESLESARRDILSIFSLAFLYTNNKIAYIFRRGNAKKAQAHFDIYHKRNRRGKELIHIKRLL